MEVLIVLQILLQFVIRMGAGMKTLITRKSGESKLFYVSRSFFFAVFMFNINLIALLISYSYTAFC